MDHRRSSVGISHSTPSLLRSTSTGPGTPGQGSRTAVPKLNTRRLFAYRKNASPAVTFLGGLRCFFSPVTTRAAVPLVEPAHRICRARWARLERRIAGDGEGALAAVVKLRCVSKLGPFSLPSPGRQMTQQKDAIARLQRALLKKRLERWCCLCALLSLLFCLLGEKKCARDL